MEIPPAMIWDKKYLKLEKGISVVFTPTKPFFDLGGRNSRGENLHHWGRKTPNRRRKTPSKKGFLRQKNGEKLPLRESIGEKNSQ